MPNEYQRSCEDELDWKDVNQLHEAILQISKSCFEYKKLCVGFLGVAMAFMIKLTDTSIDHSLFFVGLVISIGFWIADSTAYYYQRKVRSILDNRMRDIAKRNNYFPYNRTSTEASWWKAFFNTSMSLYYVLIFLALAGWGCYLSGVIS